MRPPLTLRELVTRRNTLRLIPLVIALNLLGAWFWHDANYIRHLAENPQPMTLAQLSAMGGDAAGRWVEIKLDAPPRHLLRTTTPTLDRRGQQTGEVTLDYYALAGDFASTTGRVIIVQDQTAPPVTLVAQVAGEDSYVYAKARSLLFGFRQGPLPPILLTTPGLDAQRVMWAVVIAVTMTVVIMALFTVRGLFNPLHAGPIARLRKSVRAPEGLPALVAEIDRQMAERDPKARRMGLIMLPSWLVIRNPFSFTVISASDVTWVGPGKVFFIGAQKNEIFILTRYGRKHTVAMLANVIPENLPAFARWAPWAVIGANETMTANVVRYGSFRRIGKTNARVIAMIDKHREAILAQRAHSRAEGH